MFCIFCLFVIISSYSNAYLSKVFSKLSHKNNLLSFSATVEEVSAKETEVVVIGSGLGGLCCAAMLSAKGVKTTVVESHYEIGGCAHEFYYTEDNKVIPSDRMTDEYRDKVYAFEAGPSLYSGLSSDRSPNPLKHVFQMIGEEPEWLTYDVWGAFLPEAPDGYQLSIGAEAFEVVLTRYGGPTAVEDWRKLAAALRPICEGVMELPTVAMRTDIGALQTLVFKYPIPLFKTIPPIN